MTEGLHWISSFYGELAALSAAFLWALASVLYSRIGRYLSPLKMNLLKNVLAMVMAMTVLLGEGRLFGGFDKYAIILLLLSGAAGIGVGDSAYFGALKYIGARRALLIMILSPPITGIMAFVFLGENLSAGAWLGVFITIAGVSWVITERAGGSGLIGAPVKPGIILGLLAAVGQSAGAVLSHAAFIHLNISPIRSAVLRLFGGTFIVIIAMPLMKDAAGHGYRNLNSLRRWATILLTVFIGTFLGIWLQQISLKYAAAGVAQTLFATSPLFVVPIVILTGEQVSLRAVLGALLAMIGVGFLFQH